jgi:hypothetical protein
VGGAADAPECVSQFPRGLAVRASNEERRGFLTNQGPEIYPEGAPRIPSLELSRTRARAPQPLTNRPMMKRETKHCAERLRGPGERITLLLLILLSGWLGGAAVYQTIQSAKAVWEYYSPN